MAARSNLHTANVTPALGRVLGQTNRQDQYPPRANFARDLATDQQPSLRPKVRGGELLAKVRRPAAADLDKKRAENRNNIRLV